MEKSPKIVKLVVCLALVQVAAYYLAAVFAGVDGKVACPQPDSLLYLQAARRIVEGHPFSFSEGTAVCTGTTSVLYPFILAIPYWLGARGGSLFTAGFLLNALFYLVALVAWSKAAAGWLKRPSSRVVAALLTVGSGAYAYAAFAQSDIGIWLAVSGLLAWGLACDKAGLYGAALVLGPWIRPEGMVCVIAFTMVMIARLLVMPYLRARLPESSRPERPRACDWAVCAISLVSVIGVFALNYALTGQAQFSSVANKGHFAMYPFCQALHMLVVDFVGMVRELVLGLPTNVPRCYYTIPLLGALALWWGVFGHDWRHPGTWRLYVMLLAACGGLLTVAQSGWQGTNMDRYLCWILPVFAIFIAEGAIALGKKLPLRCPRTFPAFLFVLYGLGTSVAMVAIYELCAEATDRVRGFARQCDEIMPPKATMGAVGECGMIYEMSPRKIVHLSGIYSPEITGKNYPSRLSILRHEPEKRFDYWISGKTEHDLLGTDVVNSLGDTVLTGPNGFTLIKANWSVFDEAAPSLAGKVCKARVDVGYEKDEKAADYRMIMRYGLRDFLPILRADTLNGRKHVESLRVLFGGDEMTVSLNPGKDVTVVMRTCPAQKVDYGNGVANYTSEYAFANPLCMRVVVNGVEACIAEIKYAAKGFSDVAFTIPGAAITQSPCRIAFLGDHIACGYWFFQ